MSDSGTSGRRALLTDSLAAAAALVALGLLGYWLGDLPRLVPALAWSALMVLALAFRRARPLLAVALCAAAGIGMVAQLTFPTPAVLVVPVVVYSAARYLPGHRRLMLAPLVVAGSIAGPATWVAGVTPRLQFPAGMALAVMCLAVCTVAYLIGLRLRDFARLEQLDRELTEERFTTGARQAEQASALTLERVRNEVARELHDVVAHSLAVIVVQAEGARALLTKKPDAAGQALDVIAETGRDSITEMRRIVGLLRGDELPDFEPSPGLADIAEMVGKAGPRITLRTTGEPPTVPESLGLTAYRVVQEAVTNFLKHAGAAAHAEVAVDYSPEAITIRVIDDGLGALAGSDGAGSGLRGMRERVNTMHGSLSAGPRVGGGFQVTATLPLPSRLGQGWLR